MPKKKQCTFMVTVSAPTRLPVRDVKREIRTLVNYQSFYRHDVDERDIRVKKIEAPIPSPIEVELLKSLTAMVGQMKSTGAWEDALSGEDDDLLEAVKDAEEAIAKAEGRANG